MVKLLKLTSNQWKILASAFSNMGQAVILFSFAAFFVPLTVNLPTDFSRGFALLALIHGLLLLTAGVIIAKKGS